MRIYDISQEVFGCRVFPGDPVPGSEKILSMERGDACNLTQLRMCAHNGTHVDAPYHFLQEGKSVEQLELSSFIGECWVAEKQGAVNREDALAILEAAFRDGGREASKRILIKGKATVTLEAARIFAEAGILLLGNESQTVGPEDSPAAVHLTLLGSGVVLLEGICLEQIPPGAYVLNAAPLKLGGADGAPCRAVLLEGVTRDDWT